MKFIFTTLLLATFLISCSGAHEENKSGKTGSITDWSGAEGTVTEYIKEKNGPFKSRKEQSRYTAPL